MSSSTSLAPETAQKTLPLNSRCLFARRFSRFAVSVLGPSGRTANCLWRFPRMLALFKQMASRPSVTAGCSREFDSRGRI
jgi:hypothetical protein